MNDFAETMGIILCAIGFLTVIGLTVAGLMNMVDGIIFNRVRSDYCATKFNNKLEIKNCSIKPVEKFMIEYLK